MKVVIYARVSRDDLHCENQEIVLREWVKRNNIEVFEYLKEEVSTRKTRPVKESVIKGFREGKYDTVVVTKLDRFARSLQELVMDIEHIINNGGRFVAISNGFDFSKKNYNASQQLMLNIFGSFAQFEREIIRERTLEGLARARAQGKKLGRPSKSGIYYKKPSREDVSNCLAKGMTIRDIAKELQTSKYWAHTVVKEIKSLSDK